MTSEDMEISLDFGQPGVVEDIDIDVDFATGPNDEDLELGDYHEIDEFQPFNLDTRDETMEDEEGDYGTAEVGENDYNETTLTSNDYDIDIGNETTPWHNDDVIAEDTSAIVTDDLFYTGNAHDGVPKTVTAPDDNDLLPQSQDPVRDFVPEKFTEESNIFAQDIPETNADDEVASEILERPSLNGNVPEEVEGSLSVSPLQPSGNIYASTSTAEEANRDAGEGKGEAIIDQPNRAGAGGIASAGHGSPEEGNNSVSNLGSSLLPEQGAGSADGVARDETVENASERNELSEPQMHDDNTTVTDQDQRQNEGETLLYGEDEQTKSLEWIGDSNNLDGQDQMSEHASGSDNGEDLTDALERGESGDPADGVAEIVDDAAYGNSPKDASTSSSGALDHHASLISRHDILVRYGETDYRLFAKSIDDDPNAYFFKDPDVLEYSLGDFLAALRNIIADEVLPLDELVMLVDGLGLEFGESTTSQFLEEHSFGDVLTLYDALVKNDEPGNWPELYVYLMVRPSCLKRFLALRDQAKAGKNLTEVAVYRETTPSPDPNNDENELENEVPFSEQVEEEVFFEVDPDETGSNSPNQQFHAAGEETQRAISDDISDNNIVGDEITSIDNQESGDTQERNESDARVDIVGYDQTDAPTSNQDLAETAHAPEPAPADITATNESVRRSDNTTAANEYRNEDPISQDTSATATLNGDENDEISFEEDNVSASVGANGKSDNEPLSATKATPPADEEITWESEDEDLEDNAPTSSKTLEQVSLTPGKRTRSDSNAAGSAEEQNDVKRLRS